MSEGLRPGEAAVPPAKGLESAVALAIARSRGISDAGEHVLGALGGRLGLKAGVLWRFDERREHLVAVATWAAEPGLDPFMEESRRRRFAPDEGLPGMVWSRRRLLWLPDIWNGGRYPRAPAARRSGLRAAIGIPLLARGDLVGVAELLAGTAIESDPELTRVLEGLGGQIGQLLERVHVDEAIAASEARKAAILDAALDAVVTADAEGRILEANNAITTLLGWPVADLIGARIGEVIVPPELRDRHEAGLRRYVETGESQIIGRRIEVEALHRDGRRIPVELTVNRVDMPGPPILTAFLRDVSERRRIEAERAGFLESERTARASAEAAWQRLRLVSDVSELLAAVFNYPEAFERLADRVVASIANLCLIDTLDQHGRLVRVAARHRDRRRQPVADRLAREFPPDADGPHPAASVIRTATSSFSPVMSEEFLRATCRNEEHFEIVRQLGFESYITVPLVARARILGALTLVSTDPAHRYTEQDVAVAEEIARRAAVRIDNARLYAERDRVAHVLQQGLLPQRLPGVPRLDLAARYFPAGEGIEAGGDFYDVFAAGRDRWGLVIGDVCGKGPEAAAGMGLARPALRALARAYRRPARLLRALNEELLDQTSDGRFLTVAYVQARVDGESGVGLTTCLAGHPPGILVSAGGRVRAVGLPGTLLGVFTEVRLREQRVRMLPGDVLVLYTDGLADEPGSPAAASFEELEELIIRNRRATAERIARRIEEFVVAAQRRADKAHDDVAFLVVRCAG
ncbi:MAG TPA: SpoIIE family protein phosphatase [Gaiellales bacterium]|jgi:PAS domain S-box-containing protein|nr:SpoIIE family protein phosphatase [Gaiellales bacterium]